MTAAAWSAGLLIVGAIWAAAWRAYRYSRSTPQRTPDRGEAQHWYCTTCKEWIGQFAADDTGDAEAANSWLIHRRLRHSTAPPGVDPL